MPRVALIAKYNRLVALVGDTNKREARTKLKSIIGDSTGKYSPTEKMQAAQELQKRSRNESPTRRTTRCSMCGRVHSVLRKFDMCFHCVRKYFVLGYLPGVRKSSW